jgi:hypothetical protein
MGEAFLIGILVGVVVGVILMAFLWEIKEKNK